MFINPTVAIDKGWIKFPQWMSSDFCKKCIQPNAIDFTLDHLSSVQHDSVFHISEDSKTMRDMVRVSAEEGIFTLRGNSCYDGMSDFYVTVPPGVAVMLITRSTFNRNGIIIQSGLYDSGYQGHIGFSIRNMSGTAHVRNGTRIGQIIFIQSENSSLYAGGYNHDAGTHWTNT